MKQQFVNAQTREEAAKTCPWAEKIVKVTGGFLCFESAQDYEMWKNQR